MTIQVGTESRQRRAQRGEAELILSGAPDMKSPVQQGRRLVQLVLMHLSDRYTLEYGSVLIDSFRYGCSSHAVGLGAAALLR